MGNDFPTLTLSRHGAAGGRASAAGLNTFLHSAQRFAGFGTGLADIRAQPAEGMLELTLLSHEIGGRLADNGAVHHQTKMLRPQMITACFEAVRHGHGITDTVASKAS